MILYIGRLDTLHKDWLDKFDLKDRAVGEYAIRRPLLLLHSHLIELRQNIPEMARLIPDLDNTDLFLAVG